MKKLICTFLFLCMSVTLGACGQKPQEEAAPEAGFKPALDTATDCSITVAGSYDNFEALEANLTGSTSSIRMCS